MHLRLALCALALFIGGSCLAQSVEPLPLAKVSGELTFGNGQDSCRLSTYLTPEGAVMHARWSTGELLVASRNPWNRAPGQFLIDVWRKGEIEDHFLPQAQRVSDGLGSLGLLHLYQTAAHVSGGKAQGSTTTLLLEERENRRIAIQLPDQMAAHGAMSDALHFVLEPRQGKITRITQFQDPHSQLSLRQVTYEQFTPDLGGCPRLVRLNPQASNEVTLTVDEFVPLPGATLQEIVAELSPGMVRVHRQPEAYGCSLSALAELGWTDLSGAPVSWDGYRGTGVLVHVWASWIPMNESLLREIRNLAARHRKDGKLKIVSINLDSDLGLAREAAEKARMTWPQFHPEGDTALAALQLPVSTIPEVFLLRPKGRPYRWLHYHSGGWRAFHELSKNLERGNGSGEKVPGTLSDAVGEALRTWNQEAKAGGENVAQIPPGLRRLLEKAPSVDIYRLYQEPMWQPREESILPPENLGVLYPDLILAQATSRDSDLMKRVARILLDESSYEPCEFRDKSLHVDASPEIDQCAYPAFAFCHRDGKTTSSFVIDRFPALRAWSEKGEAAYVEHVQDLELTAAAYRQIIDLVRAHHPDLLSLGDYRIRN